MRKDLKVFVFIAFFMCFHGGSAMAQTLDQGQGRPTRPQAKQQADDKQRLLELQRQNQELQNLIKETQQQNKQMQLQLNEIQRQNYDANIRDAELRKLQKEELEHNRSVRTMQQMRQLGY